MTTIPSDIYQNANKLTEEEKTDLVQATAKEIAKYFNVVPADNKRLRGHDVSRRSTPGDPTNEDTRVLMAFVKALYNALFNGEWADPNTLELAPNGKIRVKDVFVDGDRQPDVNNGNGFYLIDKLPETIKAKIAALLKENGGLSFDEDGKLKVNFQALTVDQLTALCDPDGGIVVNDDEDAEGYGKLKIDFASMDPAIMRAVVYAMTQQGGGLSVDGNGQLYVDFDLMDPSKFAKMMSDMIDAQRLSSTDGANQFYVDGTDGSDSEPETRGTPDRPFKTIQACVNFITKVYKFVDVDAYINCQNINQTTNLVLPSFDRTTAEITIRGTTFDAQTARNNPTTRTDYSIKISRAPTGYYYRHAINIVGTGVWNLRNFDVENTDASFGSSGGHTSALHVGDYAQCDIRYCSFKQTRSSSTPWKSPVYTTGAHVVYLTDYSYLAIGPECRIIGDDLDAAVTITDGEHDGTYNRVLNGFVVANSSSLEIGDTRDQSDSGGVDKRIVMTGNFRRLFSVGGRVGRNGVYLGKVNYAGVTNTDYKWYILNGGGVSVSDSGTLDGNTHGDTYLGPDVAADLDGYSNYKPNDDPPVYGNADGTARTSYVQTKTYSWYD